MAAVVVVTVVAVAYGAQSPSIGIAEFAPSARNGLEAPPATAGDAASSSGAGGRRRPTTTTTPTTTTSAAGPTGSGSAPTTTVSRARRCYGNPPRQDEDLMSPPCAGTIFEGDNGGATSRGVTATEIRIGVPTWTEFRKHWNLIFEHFNQRYEFYGRRLVPVYSELQSVSTPTIARANATSVAAGNVFGAFDNFVWTHPAFHQALAREEVVTITGGYEFLLDDRTNFDVHHPYLWSVYPSLEQVWRNLSDFACTALTGRPARHAGPSLQATTRKFGIISMADARIPYTAPLEQALAACSEAPPIVKFDLAPGKTTDDQIRTGLQKLKDQGVTSMICACAERQSDRPVSLARVVGFEPEWLLPMFFFSAGEEENRVQNFLPEERSRVFGMTPTPKNVPDQAQPWYHLQAAYVEAGGGDVPPFEPFYRQMLIMASGVQAAGPNLTPETFAAGLMSTQFPNTGAGAAPYYQPSVGFAPGDHNLFSDYALAWFSEEAEAYGWWTPRTRGSWCYLGRGARYSVGTFPADADQLFNNPNEPCR